MDRTQTRRPRSTNGRRNAIAPRRTSTVAVSSQKQFRDFLTQNLEQIATVAMKRYVTPERMMQVALVARSRVPRLAQCSPISILSSLMTAAQLGLYPDTPQQHAALVPYKNKHTGQYECTFQPMYQGLVELARRHDGLRSWWGNVVYEGDGFDYTEGLNRNLEHRPMLDDPDRGDITHVYAVIEFNDGRRDFEVMSHAQVKRIEAKAKATRPDTPWKTDWDRMAIKTALKRLLHRQRLSDQSAQAFSLNEGEPALVLDEPDEIELHSPGRREQEFIDPQTGEVLEVAIDNDEGYADAMADEAAEEEAAILAEEHEEP